MPTDLQTDLMLAERARQGDGAAWRAIYDATCDRLFAFLCWQVGDRDEAKDILQETYLQAFRKLGAWRGEAPLQVWLRTIAFGRATDWKRVMWRRRKRTTVLDDTNAPAAPESGEMRLDSERDALTRALATLSHHQRAALLLREWEERSFQEIALLLGCAESTARVHHTRARERMRTALQSGPHPIPGGEWEGQES